MSDGLTTQLKATFDGSEASQGLVKLGAEAERVGRKVQDAGDSSAKGLQRIKDASANAADGMSVDEKRIATNMRNVAASLVAGGDAAKKFEAQMAFKGVDSAKFQPYLLGLREIQQEQDKARVSAMGFGEAIAAVRALLIGAGVLGIAQQFGQIADSVTNMNSRLKLVTSTSMELYTAQTELFRIAQNSRVGYTNLADTYAQMARSTKELGVSQKDMLAITQTISQAVTISGGSAQAAEAALVQLSQGFASGTLRGEELNSVLEQTPRLAQAIAQGMGVTVGELRKLGGEGQLTAQAVVDALKKSALSVENDFSQMTMTISQATTQAENSLTRLVGVIDSVTGASASAAGGISRLAAGMDTLSSSIAGMKNADSIGDFFLAAFRKSSDLNDELKRSEEELATLSRRLATAPDNIYVKSAVSDLKEYVSWIKEAQARLSTLTGAPSNLTADPRDQSAYKMRGASYAEQARQQAAAEKDLIDVRMRAAGVNKQYLDDLAKLQAALKVGVMSERAYVDAVSDLAKRTWDASAAGKEATKAKREAAKAGNDAATAAKHEQSEYDKLISSIRLKIAAAEEEVRYGRKLSEADKLRFAISEEGSKKLTAAHKAEAESELKRLDAAQFALDQRKAQIAADLEYLAVKDQLRKADEERQQIINRLDESLRSLSDKTKNETERLQLEARLIGASNVQRKISLAQLDLEIEKREKLREIANLPMLDEERAGRREEVERVYAQRAANAAGQAYIDEWNNTVNQVESIFVNGFADMMNNGKSGWDSFCKSLKTSFYTLVAKEVYAAFAKPFVVQIVGSLMGLTGGNGLMGMLGGGGSGGSGSNVGNLMSTASNLNSLYGFITQALFGSTAGASAASLFGANAVGALGGDALGALIMANGQWAGVTAGASAAAGGTAAAGGAAAGGMSGINPVVPLAVLAGMFMSSKLYSSGISVDSWSTAQKATDPGNWFQTNTLAPILGGRVANILTGAPVAQYIFDSLFGRKLKDGGIEGEFGGESGFEGKRYEYYKGGLFRSNKTKYSELEEESRLTFADEFISIRDAVGEMATSVGLSADSLESFTSKIKLSLMGLTDAEVNTKVAEEFKRIADEMAAVVLVSDEYSQGEETRSETLARLASRMVAVNQWLDVMGDKLLDVSLVGADTASKLVDAFGGDEGFAKATSSYVSKYFTQAEQMDLVNKQIGDSLKTLGIDSVPQTREALKDLINAQDLTTESGRKAYASLLGMADVLDTVFSSSEAAKALGKDLDIQVLRATGKEDEAVALEREMRLKELEAYGDEVSKSLIDKQRKIWAAQDSDAAKQAAEVQKQAALSAAGLSVDALVGGFMTEVNSGRGAQAGVWLADTIAVGFEQAIYGQALSVIMNSIIDGVITPVVTAAMTGSTVSAAISGAAIDTMVANATAAASALATLMNDPAFKEAMAKTLEIIKDLGNSIGTTIPKMSTYKPALEGVSNAYGSATSAAESAADAAKKLADQWKSTVDSMSDEMKRLRGELLGESDDQGMAYYEGLFAIKTAQARAGDQDAADELPSIIQALEALAKGSAGSKSEVLLMQSAWLDSLGYTRDFLANKFGVDIGNEQSSVTGATTAATVIKGSANTAVLGALQSSSDNPALLAVLQSIDARLDRVEKDQRSLGEAQLAPLQDIASSNKRMQKLQEMEGT